MGAIRAISTPVLSITWTHMPAHTQSDDQGKYTVQESRHMLYKEMIMNEKMIIIIVRRVL